MKKNIKIVCLMAVSLFYLTVASGMNELSHVVWGSAVYFFMFLEVILSLICMIFIMDKNYIKNNNRIEFLIRGIFLVNVCMACEFVFMLKNCQKITLTKYHYMSKYTFQYSQLFLLIICVRHINEKTGLLKQILLAMGTMAGSWLCVLCLYSLTGHANEMMSGSNIVYMCCFTGAVILIIRDIARIPQQEQSVLKSLLLLQFLICLLETGSTCNKKTYVYVMESLFYCSYMIVILVFIRENAFKFSWEKIQSGVRDKEMEAAKGEMNRQILNAAAKEIQKRILSMTDLITSLRESITLKYESRDLKYLDKISSNCYRLFKLSHNLLAINGIQEKEVAFTRINVSRFVKEVLLSVEPYVLDNNIRLICNVEDDEIMGDVNEEGLERILINLLSNAVKYNKANGTITVRLGKAGEKLFLSVKDTGVGIPQKLQEKAFEKYERIQEEAGLKQEGSGLGLSIVKSQVALHKGKIKIESKENVGTEIRIYLPLYQ